VEAEDANDLGDRFAFLVEIDRLLALIFRHALVAELDVMLAEEVGDLRFPMP